MVIKSTSWPIFVFFFSLLVSCSPHEQMVASGGISGGGGDSLPPDPAKIEDILKVFKSAKRDIRMLANAMTYLSEKERFLGYEKLFDNETTLFDVLETTDVEILTDKPCYDSGGNEKKGSIISSRLNTICISAFMLAKDKTVYDAQPATLALIVHELSHLLKTTEDEAKSVEAAAAKMLIGVGPETSEQLTKQMADASNTIYVYYEHMLSDLKASKNIEEFYSLDKDFISEANNRSLDIAKYNQNHSLRIFNLKDSEYAGFERLQLWETHLETLHYDKNKRKVMTFQEYCQYEGLQDSSKLKVEGQVILNPSYDEALATFNSSMSFADRQLGYARHLNDNGPLPDLSDFRKPIINNPWAGYLGKYNVVSNDKNNLNCDNHEWFNITPKLDMNTRKKYVGIAPEKTFLDYFPIIEEVKLTGEPNNPSAEWSKGDLWYGEWSQKTASILKKDNVFELTLTAKTRGKDRIGAPKVNTCVYTLEKAN